MYTLFLSNHADKERCRIESVQASMQLRDLESEAAEGSTQYRMESRQIRENALTLKNVSLINVVGPRKKIYAFSSSPIFQQKQCLIFRDIFVEWNSQLKLNCQRR